MHFDLARATLSVFYMLIELIHLGHIVADYVHHQGQYAKVSVLFSGPYITGLIMGMGLLDIIKGAEEAIVPSPLSIESMRLIGMVQRYRW